MEELSNVLGEELFLKVQNALADKKLIVDDGKLIPKHRFDCINISLKEHKEKVQNLLKENEFLRNEKIEIDKLKSENAKLKRENLIVTEIMKYKARNLVCVTALLKLDNLEISDLAAEIKKQMASIKKKEPYLFFEDNEVFMLVPYKNKKTEINYE
jgi:hypothetical protein